MITIYAMDTTKLEQNPDAYRPALPMSSLERLDALPGQERWLSLAGELLFQRAVRRHCPGVPTPVSRDLEPGGKPCLLDRPDFHFNISHSGVWAVCAVADAPVGVDIQQHRGIRGRVERWFTPSEQQQMKQAMGSEKSQLFFSIWVRKEAFLKCTGEGLTRSTRSFEAANPAPGYVTQMVDFPVPGYDLAVCTRESEAEEVQLIIMPF